jgi:hypothetical protein
MREGKDKNQAMMDLELQIVQDSLAAKLMSEEEAALKIANIRKHYSDISVQYEKENLQRILTLSSDVIGRIGDIVSVGSQNKIQSIEAERDKRTEAIDKELARENISDARRKKLTKEREKIDAEYQKKIREEKRKSAEAEKAFALISIAIETAKNITEAFPNPFLMAAAGILGGLQAAAVASQEIPQYQKGGLTGRGAKNEPAGIVHRGEMVFENAITGPNEPELVQLRRVLQRGTRLRDIMPDLPGYRDGGLAGASTRSLALKFPPRSVIAQELMRGGLPNITVPGMDSAPIVETMERSIAVMEELRRDVQKIEGQQQVVFQSIASKQEFIDYLKATFPEFEDWQREKQRGGGRAA